MPRSPRADILLRTTVGMIALSFGGLPSLAADSATIDCGRSIYLQQCASCHGENLNGTFGPPVKGDGFRSKWEVRGPAELLAFITQRMPPAGPSSLPPAAYAVVTEYLLAENGLKSANTNTGNSFSPRSTQPQSGNSGSQDKAVYIDQSYRDAIARRAESTNRMSSVSEAMLRMPPDGDWLQWRRVDSGFGYSPLTEINRGNAARVEVAWSSSLPAGTNEIAPLVHDGVIFVNSSGTVQALDGGNGDVLWKFVRSVHVPPLTTPVSQPKSMAIWDNALYVPTLDNHMLALDFRSGAVLWDHPIDESSNVLRVTGGPIVVHGKVIEGVAGCAGTYQRGGCFIVALDAKTGKEVWRFNTIARPGQPGGNSWNGAPLDERFGGSVWTAGTYDSETNLVYFGTGQTYHITPLLRPTPTKAGTNDALYTDSTLALDPDTGKLIWHYQHLARDVWDLDWAFERIVMTASSANGPVKVVATIGKLGIIDVLNAKTGKYIFSFDLGLQNLVTQIDRNTGHKTTDPAFEPTEAFTKPLCPFPSGVRNFPATAYNPARGLLFVPANESCTRFRWKPGNERDMYFSGLLPKPNSDGNFGRLVAIDLQTRRPVWAQHRRAPQSSAILATAGDLIFAGSRDRLFQASDSETGNILWQLRLNDVANAFPITFAKDGAQFIAVTTGGGGPSDSAWQSVTPELEGASGSTTLWVFRLPPRE
jgi:alcohol dehydrogenase (cytochrome c)